VQLFTTETGRGIPAKNAPNSPNAGAGFADQREIVAELPALGGRDGNGALFQGWLAVLTV